MVPYRKRFSLDIRLLKVKTRSHDSGILMRADTPFLGRFQGFFLLLSTYSESNNLSQVQNGDVQVLYAPQLKPHYGHLHRHRTAAQVSTIFFKPLRIPF